MTEQGPGKLVGDSPASQKASLHSAPSNVDTHKKEGVMPISDKACGGYKPA